MDRHGDPYDRLATLMWLLRPADVAEPATLANRLAVWQSVEHALQGDHAVNPTRNLDMRTQADANE